MVVLNLDGGTEKVEYDIQLWEMFSSRFVTLGLALSGLALLRRLQGFLRMDA